MIFLDTNVVSETLRLQPDRQVLQWLERHDAELAVGTVVIAELAFGIAKIRPDERATRLSAGLNAWRQRFAGRVYAFTEEAAIVNGEIMGHAARSGRPMPAQDGMIAAIARVHAAALATRNASDFSMAGTAAPGGLRGSALPSALAMPIRRLRASTNTRVRVWQHVGDRDA